MTIPIILQKGLKVKKNRMSKIDKIRTIVTRNLKRLRWVPLKTLHNSMFGLPERQKY